MSQTNNTVSEGNVKQTLFLPSQKKVWTVIGKDNEYWVEPDLGFCACKDFYFTTLSGGKECYHLQTVRKAIKENRFTTIQFSDSEYVKYLQAIALDTKIISGR